MPPAQDFYVELKESDLFTNPTHYSAALKLRRDDFPVRGFRPYWILDCAHNKITYVDPDKQPPRYKVRFLKCDWHFLKTDETRNILGYTCTVWVREDRNEVCQTDTGVPLMQKFPQLERIAVFVSIEPQDPALFRVPENAVPFEENKQGR